MAKASVNIKGVDELRGKLKKNASMDLVKMIVKTNSEELERSMRKNAQFKGHYNAWTGKFVSPTGATRRSITRTMSRKGLKATVGPKTEYSPYLEYGTRKMSAQPFVRPSFRLVKGQFIKDMKRVTE